MGSFESTVEAIGGAAVVTLEGDVDSAVQSDLNLLVDSLPARAAVVLDMRGVSFMDLTGLHFVLTLRERSRKTRTALLVTGLRPQPQRLLYLAGEVGALNPHRLADEFRAAHQTRAHLARLLGEERARKATGAALDLSYHRAPARRCDEG
ncbi:STAS domain-containing protein [Streptomyces sp. ISL-43]|uniref:STAS domain-containing protein n=1 Tax=Streptomyces sp. ISL-43 TaxID=2819183 RepID=UPI001BE6BBE7|nr:STAS domain-containing protein [Streptomyces sp. ISL-43]MBT2446219.1 STAS domain-containing protein [Streptomyces sp. ISL-43]